MENVLRRILPREIGLPKKLPKIDLDFSELEAGTLEMADRVERMRATLDGEDEWMLCLTRNPKACNEEDNSDE